MTTPFGLRAESTRTPKASRAGALYVTPRYVTPLHDKASRYVAIPSYDRANRPLPSPVTRQAAMR